MEDSNDVYVTYRGGKYHEDKDCIYLQGNYTFPISLSMAKRKNKLPCKGCCSNNNNNNNNNKNIENNNNNNNKKSKNNKNNKNNKQNNKKENKNNINSIDADNIIFNSSSVLSQQNYSKESDQKINNIINDNINIKDEKEPKEKIKYNNSDSNDYNNSNNKESINSNMINNNILVNDNSIEDNKKKKDLKNNNKARNNIINIEINIENKNKDNSSEIHNLKEKDKKSNKYIDDKKGKNQKKEEKSNILFNMDDNSNTISSIPNNSNISENTPLSQIIPNQNFPSNINYIEQYQLNQYNPLKINNLNYNNYNLKLNIEKNDMLILENTYNNAKILLFGKSNILNQNLDKEINGNGCYMFKFEISPLKEDNNNNNYIEIEVGFTINYINTQDMNLIIDEKLINKQKINFKMGSLNDIVKIEKKLIIFHYTGIVYALINIKLGKFFIIGNEELCKRKNNIFLNKTNTEIFFIKNFYPISNNILKDIEPVFVFNKKDLQNFDIIINDKKIK